MELFHVLNRGVDKRNIFKDEIDYVRFIHDMFAFNDTKAVINNKYRFKKNIDLRSPYFSDREPIVDIHAWCLMKNHYHLLISERQQNGLTLFARRLNIGYAKYFNERHKREGTLFQGRTKKKHIDSEAYFLHILHYIHLNPLDYHRGSESWRSRKVQKAQETFNYLNRYRWSSFLDYCGKNNFPSILTTELFRDVFGDIEKYTKTYLRDIQLDTLRPYTLE